MGLLFFSWFKKGVDVIRVMSGVTFLFVVQEGRGRHSGFLFSGVTKPLRAYVDPSKVGLFVLAFVLVGL